MSNQEKPAWPDQMLRSESLGMKMGQCNIRQSLELRFHGKLQRSVLETVSEYQMLKKGEKVLVGYSGGPDSTALLHVLKTYERKLQIQVTAAHLNHGIRAEEAEADARHCTEIARRLDIPIIVEKRDVPAYQREHKLSLEMAAREVRYRFLKKTADELQAQKVALGHTADDQAEEILLNLIRGTGATGLAGIRPVRESLFIRPLLFCRKREVMQYLKEKEIPFCEDKTNLDTRYLRNRIRMQIIPALKRDFNPRIVEALVRTAQIFRDEEKFWENYIEETIQKVVSTQNSRSILLKIDALKELDTAVQRRVLRSGIQRTLGKIWGIGFERIEEVRKLAFSKGPGIRMTLHGRLHVEKRGNELLLTIMAPKRKVKFRYAIAGLGVHEVSGTLNGKLTVTAASRSSLALSDSSISSDQSQNNSRHTILYLSKIADRIRQRSESGNFHRIEALMDSAKVFFPLLLRSPEPGDCFRPLGLGGQKKLQDFFVDRKIPRHLRNQVPVLKDKKKIIWVVGHQLDDRVKVTSATEKLLLVSWQPGI